MFDARKSGQFDLAENAKCIYLFLRGGGGGILPLKISHCEKVS